MEKNNEIEEALNNIFGSDFVEVDIKDDAKDYVDNDNMYSAPKEDKVEDIFNTYQNNNDIEAKEDNDLGNKVINGKRITNKIKENKENIIYYLIGLAIITVIIYVLVNFVFGITKTVTCTYRAEDEGYDFSDEYKITYKKNKISYVESVYTYNALNDEFKGQLQYIREDKLPVIVNSNGMPGFTYIYESNDDFIKVNGYLDFTLFEFDKIDKMDQELMPISYFKIDSKTTYKTLKEDLESEGYVCTLSK